MAIAYKNWKGENKVWDPATSSYYFIRVNERIVNTDESFFSESTLGRFSTLADVQTAYKAMLCIRPELKNVIAPVKAPCAFDARETYINVERY